MNTTMPINQSQMCALPYAVKQDTQRFLAKAENMAHEIMGANKMVDYQGPTVIRHYHHYNDPFWSFPWFYPRQNVYVISDNCRNTCPNPNAQRDNKKKEKDNSAAIIVAATVVGGIGLYFLGSSIGKIQDANAELADTKAFKRDLLPYRFAGSEAEMNHSSAALYVADAKERICSRVKSSATWDLVLRSGLVASCGLAIAGTAAPAAVPAGVAYGTIGAVSSVAGMIFKWGFDSSDTMNLRDAIAINQTIQDMRAVQA